VRVRGEREERKAELLTADDDRPHRDAPLERRRDKRAGEADASTAATSSPIAEAE